MPFADYGFDDAVPQETQGAPKGNGIKRGWVTFPIKRIAQEMPVWNGKMSGIWRSPP
jgi:hypothetical protein